MTAPMNTRISVCMATHNGESYIAEQLRSIVKQLSISDEIILVDDQSTDSTLEKIRHLNIENLTIVTTTKHLGVSKAYELAMSNAKGNFIFLSDQDDVWLPGKVEALLQSLSMADLVVSDARVVNEILEPIHDSFFELRNSRAGIFRNLYKNAYVGCCMAFTADVARVALPIPKNVYMHDVWIGLLANALFKVQFVKSALILYRRHAGTQTLVSSEKKVFSFTILSRRLSLITQLLCRIARYYIHDVKDLRGAAHDG